MSDVDKLKMIFDELKFCLEKKKRNSPYAKINCETGTKLIIEDQLSSCSGFQIKVVEAYCTV